PIPNSMYRYLWSNGPKECLEFADYSFDEHFNKPIPSFPPREVLKDYIIGRAEKSELKKNVKFNTTVTSVSSDGHGFNVSYKDKVEDKISTERFDNVVVATGHFSVPYIPEYKGMSSFPGRIMHSHDFRDAEEFRNKNVVVLGSSYSAEDVALQCHKYGAKSVTIGYRNNPMGFHWPEGMKEVHYMDRIEGNKAIFKDGTVQEMDALILCTGYLHHFPFLSEELKLKTHNRLYPPKLYKGVAWQDNPNLFYLGMQDQFHTFNMFDAQAWYVRDIIMNKISLPSNDEMEKDIKNWVSKEEALEDAHQMIDFQTDYCVDLCSSIDYPKIDFELIRKNFYEWEDHKEENILTYRDKSFPSPVTGTVGPSHHTTWLEAMDDSMQTYLKTK
ncbi:NAD(P)/FAD-dependent oxidoreductase, partial [Alphaproteobacteria bacterium]|nr:NAD(P)/FAD-dependent oxidoreductase [Alphaproteobacteria bacterium]